MIIHPDLDQQTRTVMERELTNDIDHGDPPTSRRLTSLGETVFASLLLDTVRFHDDTWLSREIACCGRFHQYETSHRRGQPYSKRVPWNAPETLAEGQVRYYYLRAMALRALNETDQRLVVVRGKHVDNPRPESINLIGTTLDPQDLYNFATRTLADPGYNGPFSHNSGLTVAFAA
jgi:hypothetical protein